MLSRRNLRHKNVISNFPSTELVFIFCIRTTGKWNSKFTQPYRLANIKDWSEECRLRLQVSLHASVFVIVKCQSWGNQAWFYGLSLTRGAGDQEANWGREQSRSKQTWNQLYDPLIFGCPRWRKNWVEVSSELIEPRCPYPRRGQLDRWCRLNPPRVNATTCTRNWTIVCLGAYA